MIPRVGSIWVYYTFNNRLPECYTLVLDNTQGNTTYVVLYDTSPIFSGKVYTENTISFTTSFHEFGSQRFADLLIPSMP